MRRIDYGLILLLILTLFVVFAIFINYYSYYQDTNCLGEIGKTVCRQLGSNYINIKSEQPNKFVVCEQNRIIQQYLIQQQEKDACNPINLPDY